MELVILHKYVVSEKISFSTTILFVLLMPAFSFLAKNQRSLAKVVPLPKAIVKL